MLLTTALTAAALTPAAAAPAAPVGAAPAPAATIGLRLGPATLRIATTIPAGTTRYFAPLSITNTGTVGERRHVFVRHLHRSETTTLPQSWVTLAQSELTLPRGASTTEAIA